MNEEQKNEEDRRGAGLATVALVDASERTALENRRRAVSDGRLIAVGGLDRGRPWLFPSEPLNVLLDTRRQPQ